jgi:serine/threonine protein kinase
LAEILTQKILFDGQNSDQQQIKKIYEKMGEPLEDWPEAKTFQFWNELQPQIRYLNTLESYLRAASPEPWTDATIDLISRMLAWNPKKRLSAAEALNHPFFREEPAACHPSAFPEFKKEYHYISMKNAERIERRGQLF